MKKTLLQITQDILNDLGSDEVNSIDDTVESQQVASIIRQCYEEIIANRNWPHLQKITTLNSSLLPEFPTAFRIPENMKELIEFRYDCQRANDNGRVKYVTMKYLYPDEFLKLTGNRNTLNPNVMTVISPQGIKVAINTNYPPAYWTSFDDDWIVLDSFQADIETTLMSSKSIITAYFEPEWVHLDNAVPDLPSEAFALLTEEAKSTAFFALKEEINQKAEAKAQRQQKWLSRKARRLNNFVRYDNYGRRSRK